MISEINKLSTFQITAEPRVGLKTKTPSRQTTTARDRGWCRSDSRATYRNRPERSGYSSPACAKAMPDTYARRGDFKFSDQTDARSEKANRQCKECYAFRYHDRPSNSMIEG